MRLLIFSDLQAHQWQSEERPQRWRDCIRAIRAVRALAYKRNVDVVVFCGDLFESKRLLRADIAAEVYAEMSKPFIAVHGGVTKRIPLYALAGNHDYCNDACTLDPLQGRFARVFSKYTALKDCFVSTPEGRLLFVPNGYADYSEEDKAALAKLQGQVAAVFVHAEINGAAHAQNIVSTQDGLPRAAITGLQPRIIVAGHYHRYQRLQLDGIPVTVVGAPMQHHWGDMDDIQPRGVLFLDVNVSGVVKQEFILLNNFPKFFSQDTPDVTPGLDFVRTAYESVEETATTKHAQAELVATGQLNQTVAVYLKQRKPELDNAGFARYFKTGMRLLQLTETETENAHVCIK